MQIGLSLVHVTFHTHTHTHTHTLTHTHTPHNATHKEALTQTPSWKAESRPAPASRARFRQPCTGGRGAWPLQTRPRRDSRPDGGGEEGEEEEEREERVEWEIEDGREI